MGEKVAIQPACVDIQVERGTDNIFEFVLTDAAGDAVNINADDVEMTVKNAFDGTEIFKKTSLASTHFDGDNGTVEIIVAKENIDDEAFPNASTFWVYEVRRIGPGPNNDEQVHIKGQFEVIPSVGR